jgi:imidazolonepropionase-like amidohydrolase
MPGSNVAQETELLVEAGLSPTDALRAATIVSAQTCRSNPHTAGIVAGAPADIVLVAGAPHRNIEDLRDVRAVIASGRLVDLSNCHEAAGLRSRQAQGRPGGSGNIAPS